jgi:hypothetical protein
MDYLLTHRQDTGKCHLYVLLRLIWAFALRPLPTDTIDTPEEAAVVVSLLFLPRFDRDRCALRLDKQQPMESGMVKDETVDYAASPAPLGLSFTCPFVLLILMPFISSSQAVTLPSPSAFPRHHHISDPTAYATYVHLASLLNPALQRSLPLSASARTTTSHETEFAIPDQHTAPHCR